MNRLPPFIALRALESAARHQSYSRAADELAVTHGAVSQQIRRLEEELGVTLFVRQGNLMAPTPPALALAGEVTQALATLRRGVEAVRVQAGGPLVLSTVPAFATRWLAPRLGRMTAEVDEAELLLRVESRMADFVADGVDAGLRHGEGNWPGLEVAPLFMDRLFAVASPDFRDRHAIASLADMIGKPLLHHTVWPWRKWFERMSLGEAPPARGLVFEDSAMLLDAAVQGMGVALARSGLVGEDLRSGRLVRLFADELCADMGYFLVWRADSPKLARIHRLRDWLVAEAARETDGV
jgi:LysR family glycine cleavage system transcriptional activator